MIKVQQQLFIYPLNILFCIYLIWNFHIHPNIYIFYAFTSADFYLCLHLEISVSLQQQYFSWQQEKQ